MFKFSISDLGQFLGKSPVTIRAWERKGLVSLPREGVNRVLTAAEIGEVARIAHQAGRITKYRRLLIEEAVAALNLIELDKK